MDIVGLKQNYCPYCEHSLNAGTLVSGVKPQVEPGDFSVCAYCAQILRVDKELTLQKLSKTDWVYIVSDDGRPLYDHLQKCISMLIKSPVYKKRNQP